MKEGVISNSVLFNRKQGSKKMNRCPLSGENAPDINYKNIRVLRRYTSEKGKIVPSRISAVSPKKQRILCREINRARTLALLPFSAM